MVSMDTILKNLPLGDNIMIEKSFRDRARSDNAMIDTLNLVPVDQPSPYQTMQASRYSGLSDELTPKQSDFHVIDPEVSAEVWKRSCPTLLKPDVRKDSALDILRKLQVRSNGGSRIIDSHASTATDQFTRSAHDHLATPKIPGAHAIISAPPKDKALSVIRALEASPDVKALCNPKLPVENRVFGFTLNKISLGQKANLGEKTAQILAPQENLPHFQTATGSRILAFLKLSLRVSEPSSVQVLLANEVNILAGVEMPQRLFTGIMEIAGDKFARSAAMGDRMYHAMAVHASVAGCTKVRLAPFTSSSFGCFNPASWQAFRTVLRALGHTNLAFDQNLRELAWNHPEFFTIGYDISENSIAPFKVVFNGIKVMAMMQRDDNSTCSKPGILGKYAQKHLLDAAAFEAGGYADLLRMSTLDDERYAQRLADEEENDDIHMQFTATLNQANATFKSAIISPGVDFNRHRSDDDVKMLSDSRDATTHDISVNQLYKSGFGDALSIGALVRYTLSIAYMMNIGEVRLNCAVYLKQWKLVEMSGKDGKKLSIEVVKSHRAIMNAALPIFEDKLLTFMRHLVPYCSIGSTDALLALISKNLTLSPQQREDAILRPIDIYFRRYICSRYGSDIRYVIRKVVGRLVHAGMSDSGLMFAIRKGLEEDLPLSTVLIQHMRYKISVWKNNYSAHLNMAEKRISDLGTTKNDDLFKDLVTWQQKISMLKVVEISKSDNGEEVRVIVRKGSMNHALLKSYGARYDTIAGRIRAPKRDADGNMEKISKFIRYDHPWGDVMSEDKILELYDLSPESLLSVMENKNKDYWVVQPREMMTVLETMLRDITFGFQTALEGSVEEVKEVEAVENNHLSCVLNSEIEKTIAAKFVFSLNDAPSRRVDNKHNVRQPNVDELRQAMHRPDVKVSAGPVEYAVPVIAIPRRSMAAVFSQTVYGAGVLPPITSRHTRRRPGRLTAPTLVAPPRGVRIVDLLEHCPTDERLRMIAWLTRGVEGAVTVETSCKVLHQKFQCSLESVSTFSHNVYNSFKAAESQVVNQVEVDDDDDVEDAPQMYQRGEW